MDNNKQNSVLLIIIAVATLLVAVVGATFAYFTANNSSGSTVTVNTKTGSMNILFSDGDDAVDITDKKDIQPSNTKLVEKEFTIEGRNITKSSVQTVDAEGKVTNGTESSMLMPFTVKLNYTTTFINNELHVLVKQTKESTYTQNIKFGAEGKKALLVSDPKNTAAPQQLKDNTELNSYYDYTIGSGETKGASSTGELELVYGEFKETSAVGAGSDANVVKFKVIIVFPDTGENQDDNKQAKFDGILQVVPAQARVAA